MKQQLVWGALLTSLFLTACDKQEKASEITSEASVAAPETINSPEQQMAIDSVDKPILDEKNKDIPTEVANAPADTVTAHEENSRSK